MFFNKWGKFSFMLFNHTRVQRQSAYLHAKLCASRVLGNKRETVLEDNSVSANAEKGYITIYTVARYSVSKNLVAILTSGHKFN